MTTIRRINVSQIDGNDANANNDDEIRPFGETAFYLDTEQNNALTLMIFDGVRTHRRSKILRPGVFYGSNENSSDGNGFDTIKLIPDAALDFDAEYTNDQYIIIEPTVGEPGHIHIRSGGVIDQSTADLFLGGELNHVKVSDTNNAVIISTDAGVEGDTREWEFDASGYLQFPGSSNGKIGEGIIPGLVVYSDLSFGILTNLANTENSRAWTFEEDGSLTLPASGIITAPDDEFFKLQAKDTDSLLRNEINLDPNNGTYMSVWSGELDTAFSTADWATASWQNNGGQGYAIITNAENLADFWAAGPGSIVNNIEVSINGGARTPVQYYGNNDEQYDVELLVTDIPGSTTEITSLIFYYQTKSSINIDYDNGQMLLEAQSMNITLETSDDIELRSGGELKLRSAGQDSVRIYTDNSTYMWDFNNTGSLTLPREGKIYGIGAGPAGDRGGYISWAGNSSGDGLGFNTMRLVPDLQGLEEADQYIILDPTSPGHIHIRAGGTQDNSQAILYFGGENSHVKIDSGPNPPVTVTSANNSWTFGTDGGLQFPDTTEQTTAFTTSPTLNVLKIDDGVHEKFQELADATGTVPHDCSSGQIFYHSSPDANWTVNLTNLNLSSGYATTATIIIDQDNTGYYPNALQIGGSAQTINWQGNATPTPSSNRIDIVSFSILAVSGGYIVFGQLTGF